MLQKLSEQIQECYHRAHDARRKADGTDDPKRKADFLEMEKHWLTLARSYEFSERLTDFTARNSDWPQRFDEHLRASIRPVDARPLEKIIQEINVDALFERMWLASIVESSEDAIISKNLDGVITSWNKSAQLLFGYPAEEVVGKSIAIIIPPERLQEEDMILMHIRRGERLQHFETVRRRKDGSPVDVSLTVSPIRGTEGRIVGASKIARDITERKRSEAQVAVLAREAEHRSKNLLANVRAMVRLSESDSPQGLKDAIEGRIGALANVHSLFVQSRWMGAELGILVRQELSPYCLAREIRTEIDGPAVMLKPDLAQAVAVVLHELATNSAKCGSLSATKGRVRVEWSRALDGNIAIRWTETGGPSVTPPTRKGFGSGVMESMIGGHLGGKVQLEWRADGLVCEITLPT